MSPTIPHDRSVIKVAMIDDHRLFRQGLRAVLGTLPDLGVVVEGDDLDSLDPALETLAPDVAVVDVSLRGTSGLAATAEILRRCPRCRVLMLTMHADEDMAARAFSAGASGYALKDQDAMEVVAAIRTVAAGGRYLAPSLSPWTLSRRVSRGGLTQLSRREREVFDLIVAGKSNRDVADGLAISIKTVEAHRASINRKLGAHSTADLVRCAARHGLLEL